MSAAQSCCGVWREMGPYSGACSAPVRIKPSREVSALMRSSSLHWNRRVSRGISSLAWSVTSRGEGSECAPAASSVTSRGDSPVCAPVSGDRSVCVSLRGEDWPEGASTGAPAESVPGPRTGGVKVVRSGPSGGAFIAAKCMARRAEQGLL